MRCGIGLPGSDIGCWSGQRPSVRLRHGERGLKLATPEKTAITLGLPALAVLLVLALSRVMAFASPPDPTWIHGIYDGADGDEVVMRTMNRVGLTAVTVAAPMPGRRSEAIVVQADPDYPCRRPGVGARGPPPRACLPAACFADLTFVESTRLNVALPTPVPWATPCTDPPPGRWPFAWLRGPPGPLRPDRQALSSAAHLSSRRLP